MLESYAFVFKQIFLQCDCERLLSPKKFKLIENRIVNQWNWQKSAENAGFSSVSIAMKQMRSILKELFAIWINQNKNFFS